jgi:hypothetical protein
MHISNFSTRRVAIVVQPNACIYQPGVENLKKPTAKVPKVNICVKKIKVKDFTEKFTKINVNNNN